MRIYRIQNPALSMAEVQVGAECAWRKLNPKYKRLYGPRVYTPTHFSPSPETCRRRRPCTPPSGPDNCPCGLNGLGQTLVGVLTKKLVESCKDQLSTPEQRRLIRGLIGSEVTVKICNVRKL